MFFECFNDRFRRIFRFFVVVTGVRYHAQGGMEEAGRRQVACFFRGTFRVFRANRLLPDQLISARLIGRYERLIAIFNAISESQQDARCEGQLAVGFRDRIIQGLSTCQRGRATELFRVSRVRRAFRQGFIRMRTITRVVIDEGHFEIMIGRSELMSRFTNDLGHVRQAPIGFGETASAMDAQTRRSC